MLQSIKNLYTFGLVSKEEYDFHQNLYCEISQKDQLVHALATLSYTMYLYVSLTWYRMLIECFQIIK
ncbi:hypothetical protein [Bacillus sp. dmp10]|uniref:hypothetical protein n=1 Tax=Bacillus sp. dmp10 TaxID=2293321 RepID=UPI000E2F2E9B|nr:hypothetical protein DZB83_18930 [Bacillus sp. dmp10]